MKTIKMKDAQDSEKKYRKKCIQFEKFVKSMAIMNADQNDRAAAINQEINRVVAERKFLLKKLAECNIVVEPTQLYYKGKCEAKMYKDCCKERTARKRSTKKSQ